MNPDDIIRVGKKLFKIWRIELESKKSKEQFLKKAQKFEFKKIDLCKNKTKSTLIHSETTRMNKPFFDQQKRRVDTYDEDRTDQKGTFNTVKGRVQFSSKLQGSKSSTNYDFQTENVFKNSNEIVSKTQNDWVEKVTDSFAHTKSKTIEDQKLLLNNSNNTIDDIPEEDGDQQDSGMFHKINVAGVGPAEQDGNTQEDLNTNGHGHDEYSQQDISHSKVQDNDGIQSDENTTSEEEEEEKPLINVQYSAKHLKIQSKIDNDNEVSKSEVDLEGVYNAEQNEFIKVMVGDTSPLTDSDRCREQKELQLPC